MNGKTAKAVRRTVDRTRRAWVVATWNSMATEPLRARLGYAWRIVLGRVMK